MKKALGLFTLFALIALAACAPSYPSVQGTWTDNDAFIQACSNGNLLATLTLTQAGAELSGSFVLDDLYEVGADGTGTFAGTVTTGGVVTGEVTVTDGGAGTGGPALEFALDATLNTETGELVADFTTTHTIDCGGTPATVTVDATFTK